MKAPSSTRETRSSKKKLIFYEEDILKQRPVSNAKNQSPLEYKKVYTRKRTIQVVEKLNLPPERDIIEPMEEISVMEVEEASDTKQKRRNYKGGQQKDKGKQPMGTSRRLGTGTTNKFRLNAKALFDPSLKT